MIGEREVTASLRKVCSVQISHTHFRVEFPLFPQSRIRDDSGSLRLWPVCVSSEAPLVATR